MKESFELIILTKSAKYGAFCVAGIDPVSHRWRRLITDDEDTHGALNGRDVTDSKGREINVLDCVKVTNAEYLPGIIQTENYLIDRASPMQYVRSASIREVLSLNPDAGRTAVFLDDHYVMRGDIGSLGHSLEMHIVRSLKIYTVKNGDKLKTKADFILGGRRHEQFSVTDRQYYLPEGDVVEMDEACIVCSIAEDEWANGHFKYIAAIYNLDCLENRIKRQANGLLQERFSATYGCTNPNFVFQNIPDDTVSDPVLLSILQVVDNILCRGTVTPPSAFLCRQYLHEVMSGNAAEKCIDFDKWNDWKQRIAAEKIHTYSRDIPLWEHAIKAGNEIKEHAAHRLFYELLPEWFDKTPVVQLIRPGVRFDEISSSAAKCGLHESRVDFYLERAKLVIEIDDEENKQRVNDAKRSNFLKTAGCTEVRIPISAVWDRVSIEKYRRQIAAVIENSGLVERYERYAQAAKDSESYRQRKKLDIILRFELLFVSLMKHARLLAGAPVWKLFLSDDSFRTLCIAAYNDVRLWFENISGMCGRHTRLPALEFSDCRKNADAAVNLAYNKCWTDEALDNPEIVFVRNDYFENSNYYELQDAGMIPYSQLHMEENCEEQQLFFLRNFFGYTEFKEGQRRIVCRALSGKDTIGILPTGSGKSLCYQMAGLLQPGITMTVCPLVSLIKDQKMNLDRFGIDRTVSVSSAEDSNKKEASLRRLRNKQISFIWIAPERFQIEKFRRQLCDIGRDRVIKYAVLDEVHCLSEWGHDFRTSYLVLVDTIHKYCGKECVLYGLTATASDFVLKDIIRTFGITMRSVVSSETMHRPELTFHVVNSKPDQRIQTLKDVLKEIRGKYEAQGDIFEPRGEDSICGIVFTVCANGREFGSKEIAEHLDRHIGEGRKYVRCFNSQMKASDVGATKQQIQDMYINNQIPLLVATKAFGMGINKPNVRYTIHQSLPWSSEAFYQEAGRAGRSSDPTKKASDCYVIYCKERNNPAMMNRIFDKNTPVEEVKELSSDFAADLKPIFYLWGLSNLGVSEEMEKIEMVLDSLKRGIRQISIGKSPTTAGGDQEKDELYMDKTAAEKTLYHLSLLGFIKDWTIDYADRMITVYCNEDVLHPDQSRLLNSLYGYIRRYDPDFNLDDDRADYEEYRKINEDESEGFVRRYMRILLKWTEANIVYFRKRSIANMISDIENSGGDGARLKELIEKRFVIAQEESPLAKIQDRDMNVQTWFEAIEEEDSDGTIAVLQRHLESNQNNPAANYVISLLQLLTNRESAYGLESYLTSSLEALRQPEDRKAVMEFAVQAAKKSQICAKNRDILGSCLARTYPEHARYVHRMLGDRGSLCEILSEQLSVIRKLRGVL